MKKIINLIGDKNCHSIVNIIIVLIIGLLINPLIGVIVAVIVSVGKEIYDKIRPNGTGFDYQDLIADAIGILLGLFILV